jgi:capsular polysaccharide biosynthesis protein
MVTMYEGDRLFELLDTDEYAYVDDRPADIGTGLTSLGFIKAALRRRRRLWYTLAAVGLVIGLGLAVKQAPSYQASTSLLLTPQAAPGEASGAPILNEQTIAESRAVAELAMKQLGLQESVSHFQGEYTVTAPTDRLLVITVSAPSSSEAVTRASALATEFLQFRASMVAAAQKLVADTFQQQLDQAQQNVNSLAARVQEVSAEPTSPAQQADLKGLQTQYQNATAALATTQQASDANELSSQETAYSVVHDSQVLDPASPLPPHSRLKHLIEYAFIGLIGGLLVGMGFVIISALISDRLRQRDDVARALGASVKLSVGTVRLSGRQEGRGESVAARSAYIKQAAAYLDRAVPPSPRGPANLAVVPVDDVDVPAACLVSLALSCAQRGLRVVVADLCEGAPAARLLGVADPGVGKVNVQDMSLIVIIPDPDELLPVGPFQSKTARVQAAGPVVTASASADLLLTLATLDPALGGEHLAGWARSAVAFVTAGKSSAAKIHAVGEMIRLSGMSLISGVLVGADETDESVGEVTLTPDSGGDATEKAGFRSGVENLIGTADDAPGMRRSGDR